MLGQVFIKLKPYFLMYLVLLVIFACILGILDWGNYEFSDDDPELLDLYPTVDNPLKEYLLVNKFISRMIEVIRISIGDFDFSASVFMGDYDNKLYWFMFLVMCFVTTIVYMNFIIAEVSATYAEVTESI